ncbi:hypothetical protein N7G274_000582 [Stereocaulon virgatum]|uniref:Uncharacterized protein n=1 Tax=Stereocaulon virgatum TaxID=373712 RepID=A0ABR4AT84_9LECA
MAEYSAETLSLFLRVEQLFHGINLAISNPSAPTPQEEHAEALANVHYYTSKVIYYRKAQGSSVGEPSGDLETNGRWSGPCDLNSVYIRAHVDEGCAAEQLFKWYAKAVTGKFLPRELLMKIVEVGYPWHYPVIPKTPVSENLVEEMMELGVAMGWWEVGEFVRKPVL